MGGLFPPEEEKVVVGAGGAEVRAGGAPTGGLPCPGFEGFEKRLEVEFGTAGDDGFLSEWDPKNGEGNFIKAGLRAIPREELDTMLDAAACTIVSHLPNEFFDSYVLSESSLFVYPSRVVIKTCGTTKLLQAIPHLLESAGKLSLLPRRCRYTRGTFMFPEVQPAPHNSFTEEAKTLEKHFGHLGAGGKAFVLGDALKFPNWHIYIADAAPPPKADAFTKTVAKQEPVYTLEMCMTKLNRKVAGQFYQEAGFATAAACTKASGIAEILPKSQIDDFLFEPCGYSMNGIEDNAHSTVHITPEDGFSYASFEAMGYGNKSSNLSKIMKEVASTFKPGTFSVAIHGNGPAGPEGPGSWGGQLPVFMDYACTGTMRQELPLGASVVFHTYTALSQIGAQQEVSPLPLYKDAEKEFTAFLPGKKVDDWALTKLPPRISSNEVKSPVLDVLSKFGAAPATVISSFEATLIGPTTVDVDNYITSVVEATSTEEAFYVMDLGVVLRLWNTWTQAMPRVTPFYAVKCNPDPALLALLASLGAGFDVASKAELEAVLSLGVGPERIIFANPCKLPGHITAAANEGVNYTTFDSESELRKLKKYNPGAQAVLRLRSDDRGARCPLGVKYGAELEECEELLVAAKELGVHVAGVAFHVGSGAADPRSYADGIHAARSIFDIAARLGMAPMKLLDIGGGFTSKGGHGVGFSAAGAAINEALEKYFPAAMGVRVIGEPGRFFAEAPATLATHVFGTRFRGKGLNRKSEYWINDGLYGSMNCLLYDHAELTTRPLAAPGKQRMAGGVPWVGEKLYQSTIFGPTCDGLDTVMRDTWLPHLECGDWLVFPRMGAYTQAAGSSFNGFSTADIKTLYVYSPVDENADLACMDSQLSDDSSSDGGEENVQGSEGRCDSGEGSGWDSFEDSAQSGNSSGSDEEEAA